MTGSPVVASRACELCSSGVRSSQHAVAARSPTPETVVGAMSQIRMRQRSWSRSTTCLVTSRRLPTSRRTRTVTGRGRRRRLAAAGQVDVRLNGGVTARRDVVEYHFAVAERTSLTEDVLTRCTDRIKYVQLSGNISNRPTMGTYRVAYNGNAVFIDRTTGNYVMLVEPGTHDLLILHGSDRQTI